MDFFFVLTMRFLSGGNIHQESHTDTITAADGESAEHLFWRAHELFKEVYKCESFGVVLCWSLMPNVLPVG